MVFEFGLYDYYILHLMQALLFINYFDPFHKYFILYNHFAEVNTGHNTIFPALVASHM